MDSEITNKSKDFIYPPDFNGEFDYDFDEVIAVCVNSSTKTSVLVEPIGLISDENIFAVTKEQAKELFPSSGLINSYAGSEYPEQPQYGDIGIWKVVEIGPEKAHSYRIRSKKREVFEVYEVPFLSTQPDSVRDFILEQNENQDNHALQFLFRLKDGIIVDNIKKNAPIAYQRAWNELRITRIAGRNLIIGKLPKEDFFYECSPLPQTITKIFKLYSEFEEDTYVLTKKQYKNLCKIVGSSELKLDSIRRERLLENIDLLLSYEEDFSILIDSLMALPLIQKTINMGVTEKIELVTKERSEIENQIALSKKEYAHWQEKIIMQKNEYNKMPADIETAIKNRFEKAQNNAISTIADITLFQALLGQHNTVDKNEKPNNTIYFSRLDRISVETNMFKHLGISKLNELGFMLCLKLAYQVGLIVSFTGIGSRVVGEAFARTVAETISYSTKIGLIDDSLINRVVDEENDDKNAILLLLDGNLSPLDIYAKAILDSTIKNILSSAQKFPLNFLITISNSVSSLPVPDEFKKVTISLDLERKYNYIESDQIEEISDVLFDETEPDSLYSILWAPAVKKLQLVFETLEMRDKVIILTLLSNMVKGS